MRLTLTIEGGLAYFPGLSRPLLADTDQLSAAEAEELKRLVDGARLFDRPASAAPPPGAADYIQYTITVQQRGRRRSIRFTDPIEDPALETLIDYLKAKDRRQ